MQKLNGWQTNVRAIALHRRPMTSPPGTPYPLDFKIPVRMRHDKSPQRDGGREVQPRMRNGLPESTLRTVANDRYQEGLHFRRSLQERATCSILEPPPVSSVWQADFPP